MPYSTLKAAIAALIYDNVTQDVSGTDTDDSFQLTINEIGDFRLKGFVAPTDTPVVTDIKVSYLCGAGTYTNFGGEVIPANHLGILFYDGDGTWTSDSLEIAGLSDPMTARGDVIYRNSGNVTDRLGLGSLGDVLGSNGTDLVWVGISGVGTVISITAGDGMDFSSITGVGSVILGTPSTLSSISSNALTANSHTHEVDTGISDQDIVIVDSSSVNSGEYAKFTANGVESVTTDELKSDLGFLIREELNASSDFTFVVPDGYIISTMSVMYKSGTVSKVYAGTTLGSDDLVYGIVPVSGDVVPRIYSVDAEVAYGSDATVYIGISGSTPVVDVWMLLVKIR